MDHGACELVPMVTFEGNQARCRISLPIDEITPRAIIGYGDKILGRPRAPTFRFDMFLLSYALGRAGAPSHFSFFGDAIAKAHVQCGLTKASTQMRHSFRSVLYGGDGIFADVNAPERLPATTQCWEHMTKGVLGQGEINGDKLNKEGTWGSQHISIGFVFNLGDLTIAPPEEKIDCAEVLFTKFFEMSGSQFITLWGMQRLRGHIEHFQSTSEVWKLAKGPTDALLACSDEQGYINFYSSS